MSQAEGAAKRECTRPRCSTSGSRNYADSKDEMPAARRTAPGGCKKHATLQVRVRTAKYPFFLIRVRESRNHPFFVVFPKTRTNKNG